MSFEEMQKSLFSDWIEMEGMACVVGTNNLAVRGRPQLHNRHQQSFRYSVWSQCQRCLSGLDRTLDRSNFDREMERVDVGILPLFKLPGNPHARRDQTAGQKGAEAIIHDRALTQCNNGNAANGIQRIAMTTVGCLQW